MGHNSHPSGPVARAVGRTSQVQDRIEAKIVDLATDPRAPANQVKTLIGAKALRQRVGDYRVSSPKTVSS
jgi:hypothetical protein